MSDITTNLTDKAKFEILETEYSLLTAEIDAAYSIIQNRISTFAATYAFIFSAFVSGLSQWEEFREYESLIIIESTLLLISFVLLIPAMFITKFRKWEGRGNPKNTISHLKKSKNYEQYYNFKAKDWPEIVNNNTRINSIINNFLIIDFSVLVITILVILFHITLTL